jgi:hypothetical protein
LIAEVQSLQAGDDGGVRPAALDVPPPIDRPADPGASAAPDESADDASSESAASAPGQLAKGEPDPRVQAILEETDFQFTVNSDGNFKIIYDAGAGRTQVLFVESNVERLGELEIREVWSPIGQSSSESFPAAVSDRLLRVGASMKVGAVEVVAIDGKPTAYFSAKVPADLDAAKLISVINAVATTADENENALFGGDKY